MKRFIISLFLLFLTVRLFAQTPAEVISQANQLTGNQEFDKVIALLTSNEQKLRNAPSDFIVANDLLLANAYYFIGQFERSIPLFEKYINLSIEDSVSLDMQRPFILKLGMSYFYGGYLEKSDTLMSRYVFLLKKFDRKDLDYLLSLKTLCYIQLLEDKMNNCCVKADDELLSLTDSISKLSDNDSIKVPYIKNMYATVFDHEKYLDNWLSLTNNLFSSNLFSDLIKLDNQSRFKEVLYVTELYKDSLSSFYNPDSLLYSATLNMISKAYSRNIYENKDTALWVEPFFKKIEETLSESNPNFFSMIGNCATVRNINNYPDKYLTLLKCQLNYARQNSIDTITVVKNLISAYIKNNQIDNALKIMQNIDENYENWTELKMFARFDLLTALFGNKTNSEYQSLFVIYANKYLGDFVQHNFEYTKDIIRWLFPICFETNNYANLDNWIKIFENFPNTSLREIEDLYDMISENANYNKLLDIALEYRIKSLKLCDEINDDTLLWDGTGKSLKVEELGYLYGKIGDCQKQIACFKEGLKIREKITGKINEGYISQLTGTAAYIDNCILDYESSLNLNIEALECIEELYGNNSLEYYDQLFHLGSNYKMVNNFDKAMECYNKCLSYYKEKYGENSEEYLNTMLHISNVYGDKGEPYKAIEILESLQNKYPTTGRYYSTVIHNLASTYSDLGDYKKSITFSLKEEKLLSEKNIEVSDGKLLSLYSNIGNTYTKLEEFEKAESYYSKGISIIKGLSDKDIARFISSIADFQISRAQFYMKKGDFKTADVVLTELESFYNDKKLNNPQTYVDILLQRAEFYTSMKNYHESLVKNYII